MASDAGLILAVVGLGALVAFGQTSRRLMVSKLSTAIGLLTIPLAIAALWRIALDFGWWTIVVFVVVSLTVGTVNAIAARTFGIGALYAMQSWVGLLAAACIAGAWLL